MNMPFGTDKGQALEETSTSELRKLISWKNCKDEYRQAAISILQDRQIQEQTQTKSTKGRTPTQQHKQQQTQTLKEQNVQLSNLLDIAEKMIHDQEREIERLTAQNKEWRKIFQDLRQSNK